LYASEDEFVVGEVSRGETSKHSYFNARNMPNVYVGTQCREKCSGTDCCWSVIRNQNGNIIRSFSSSDNVATVANGRYEGVAYLYYAHTYGSGKNRKTKYYLVDQNHRKYNTPPGSTGMVNLITKERELVSVMSDGVYKNGTKILHSEAIEIASISNNPQGDIAIVAVLELSDAVRVTDLSRWLNTNIVLSATGDRDGILSVYPKNSNEIFTSIYKNVNVYNKGIVGAYVDFANEKVVDGWIFNSAVRNVGFDLSMYVSKNRVFIGSEDSTNREKLVISGEEDLYKNLTQDLPKHTEGFEDESMLEFLVGGGLQQTNWYAHSKVEDTQSEVKYDIGQSIYESLYFEGRLNSTRLSVSYLQNQAKEVGGLRAKASKILNVLFDFDGLIGDSSSLRLKMTKGNVNGVATFENDTTEFESEIARYGVYVMKERGLFGGLEYTNYTTPSAVGFSGTSKSVQYAMMDPNFEISTYSLVFGYDEISYAKRYETDLSRFYVQGLGGIGWANYDLSSSIKNDIESRSAKNINYTGNITFNAALEVGYIFQQRFKMAQGLGYSLTVSYKARGAYYTSGQSDDSDSSIESDELELEMTRYDIWHGPYISANIMF
jgi:hypothetical protein